MWQRQDIQFQGTLDFSMRTGAPLSRRFINAGFNEVGVPIGILATSTCYWTAYLAVEIPNSLSAWVRNVIPKEYRIGKVRMFLKEWFVESKWLTHNNTRLGQFHYYYDAPVQDITIVPGTYPNRNYLYNYVGVTIALKETPVDRLVIDLANPGLTGTLTIYYDVFEDDYVWYS